MITSSVLNSITFKYLNGGNPNQWNTLNENRYQAGYTNMPYYQPFQHGETIYLQFTSDTATIPTLNIFAPEFKSSISGTLVSSYITGVAPRYFFNFEIDLGSEYYDQIVRFTLVQGAITLTSEPICYVDLTDYLTRGEIKKFKYTNLDRNNSDLSNGWVDWSVIDFMQFYIEAVDIDPVYSEESEILEGSQNKVIVSASNYSGINLKSGGIADYQVLKLKAASSLDYFEVNGIQYIKEGEVDASRIGNSTLHEISVNLTEKNTVGLNVDDLGIEFIDQTEVPMAIIPKRNTAVTPAGWQVENPEGYMLHSIWIKHAATSAANAIVNVGTTILGSELVDNILGDVPKADYSTSWLSVPIHYVKDPDSSSNIYVSVTGAGAVLDMIMNFDTVTPE